MIKNFLDSLKYGLIVGLTVVVLLQFVWKIYFTGSVIQPEDFPYVWFEMGFIGALSAFVLAYEHKMGRL